MKLKKIIRSLKKSNADTANKIMNEYPVIFAADKVFEKSFKKYLSLKDIQSHDETASCGKSESGFSHFDERRNIHRFFKTGGIVLATTAYIGVFILIMNIADHSPSPDNNSPDGLKDQSMITIQSKPNEKSEIPTIETTAENRKTTSVSTTKISKETAVSTAVLNNGETALEFDDHPHDVPISESAEDTTEPAVISDIADAAATIPAESTEPAITTTTTQTFGKFEIKYGSCDYNGELWDEIIFIPPSDNVDVREHSYEIEGFTILKEDAPNGVWLQYEDGTKLPLYIYPYEEFGVKINPKIEHTNYLFSQENGRAVWRELKETQGAPEMTAWDDGCHICFTFTARENYDKVEILIKNLS